MNREQELKIELLSTQREKLVEKRENLQCQINQIDQKIDRIRNYSNNQKSGSGDIFGQRENSSSQRISEETELF